MPRKRTTRSCRTSFLQEHSLGIFAVSVFLVLLALYAASQGEGRSTTL